MIDNTINKITTLCKNVVKRYTPLRMWFYRDINAGDYFTFNTFNKNPFETSHRVKVKEIKDGFVRYDFVGSVVWVNESMSIVNFNFCYIPEK